MTRDGLVEQTVSGDERERVSRRLTEDDYSVSTRGMDDDMFGNSHAADTGAARTKQSRVLKPDTEAEGEILPDAQSARGHPDEDAVSSGRKKSRPMKRDSEHLPEDDNAAFSAVSSDILSEDAGQETALAAADSSMRTANVSSDSSVGRALQKRHEALQKDRKKSRLQQKKRQQRLYAEMHSDSDAFSDAKEQISRKQKNAQVQKAAKKQGRLSFGDEVTETQGMKLGASGRVVSRGAAAVSGTGAVAVHAKVYQTEEENAAVKSAHRAELLAESSVSSAVRQAKIRQNSRQSRLRESSLDLAEGASATAGSVQGAQDASAAAAKKRHTLQKMRLKREYQKAAYRAAKSGTAGAMAGEKTAQAAAGGTQKVKRAAQTFFGKNKGLLLPLAILGLLFVIVMVSLGSCSAALSGVGTTIISTTYPSTDEEIYAVEDAYAALEAALNTQINNMESTHPGYDEYNYQINEISHNPYQLISYFSARYGEFTYEQVSGELEEIFREQYSLVVDAQTETTTETRTVSVGESLGQVVTSGYCNCSICCGIWAGGATASGAYPTAEHTIAVDASNPIVPIGTRIVMNGVEYVVEDTGNFARYGVDFDVYYDSHEVASAHGHQTWEAYIADSNGQESVEVTTTTTVTMLNVTLTNNGLDAVLRSRMSAGEIEMYDLYNMTYGNREDLFDVSSISSYGTNGLTYEVAPEALSDTRFANMITEAEKYLGYAYVWGGSSPSTGFDCSGFVSWVINNCGNGWSVGRLTADGLYGICTPVSASEAQPGDLVFFTGTYNTSGISHVGIYVGDGMMIHCGNPIQYTSLNSTYWTSHLYCYGRLP